MPGDLLLNWLDPKYLAWCLLRVAMVWLAFYSTGRLLMKTGKLKDHFGGMPAVIPGMLIFMILEVLLSVFGILNRTVLPAAIIIGVLSALYAVSKRFIALLKSLSFRGMWPAMIIPAALLCYILVTNLMLAGRPDLFQDDPHVTYMVQPDRWLNHGSIYFLDETVFSGFPMTSEMLLLLPSSLSTGRMDQLILGQIFEMSMLIALACYGARIFRLGLKWLPAAFICILGCNILVIWGELAKPDMTALFFVTVAMSLLYREISSKRELRDYSAFLAMGLALTSKVTAYLVLIPFSMMFLYGTFRNRWNWSIVLKAAVLTVFMPVVFAIRTMVHTGSPFYPHMALRPLLKPQWTRPDIHISLDLMHDRGSYLYERIGKLRNVWHYFREWGASLPLLLTGMAVSWKNACRSRNALVLAAVIVYSALSIWIFYPAWWGAKYGIMLIPFTALLGIHLLRDMKHAPFLATLGVSVLFFLYSSSLSPVQGYDITRRNHIMASYLTGEPVTEDLAHLQSSAYTPLMMWMNSHLPEGSRVLSLYSRKRYFSDLELFVLERHPVASRLYLENTIEEEIGILEQLGIDYVMIRHPDPIPMDCENTLEILTRTGRGDVLEPLIDINGYTLYEFCPGNLMEARE